MPNFTGGATPDVWALTYANVAGVPTSRGDGAGDIDTLRLDLTAFSGGVSFTLTFDNGPGGFGSSVDTYVLSTGEAILFRNFEQLQITGGQGNDVLSDLPGHFDDVLKGNGGNDTFEISGGADIVDGGTDTDSLVVGYTATTTGITVSAISNGTIDGHKGTIFDGSGNSVAYDNIENILIQTGMTVADDLITTSSGNDLVTVYGGTDTVNGGTGNDRLMATYFFASGGITISGFGAGTLDGYKGKISDGTASNTVNFDNIERIEVETGTGAFNDVLVTGSGDDSFQILNGVDSVDGKGGSDKLFVFYTPSTHSVTTNSVGAGTIDGIKGAITDGAGRSVAFDNINVLQVGGGSIADTINMAASTVQTILQGNGGADVLTTGSANDTLQGDAGADVLAGGAGKDQLDGGADDDVANYGASAAGVQVNLSLTGAQTSTGDANGDKLISIEGVFGSGFADTLTGNGGSNELKGGGGADRLDGGAGADQLSGGSGDDLLYVDNVGDTVQELSGGGSDRVLTKVNYTLAAGQEIELFTPLNAADTAALNLTGNELAQRINGNAGKNVIDGKGGADTMDGLGGDDLIYVDNAADVVLATAGAGSDRVLTSVNYTLKAGQSIELFTPVDAAATTAINLTGNDLAQTIRGNAGKNVIDGKGGADTMDGLGGDDLLYVDNAADVVTEAASAGSDRVLTSVSYTLKAGQSIELFTPVDAAATTTINLTGNDLAQTINGNAGANVINGKGGNDTLKGLGGNDTFLFDTALNAASNVDNITDFTSGGDKIKLENSIFTTLTTTGTLAAGAFFVGTAAHDADDRIIYNATTGALTYDSNGNAAGGATQFATLTTHPALANTDFIVA